MVLLTQKNFIPTILMTGKESARLWTDIGFSYDIKKRF